MEIYRTEGHFSHCCECPRCHYYSRPSLKVVQAIGALPLILRTTLGAVVPILVYGDCGSKAKAKAKSFAHGSHCLSQDWIPDPSTPSVCAPTCRCSVSCCLPETGVLFTKRGLGSLPSLPHTPNVPLEHEPLSISAVC